MQRYIISKISGEPDWDTVPGLPIDHHLWLPQTPIRAEARISYDLEGIYVQLKAWEENIRAEVTDPLGKPYEDSCLEFFFKPCRKDKRYINIEVNPNGCCFIGIGNPDTGILRIVNYTIGITPKIQYFDGGWQVSYQIPMTFIQLFFPDFLPVSGETLSGNCYKCGDLTVQPHFIAAYPIDLPKPNFHCIEFFGEMEFE